MKRRLALLCATALIFLFAAIGAQATAVVDKIELPENMTVDVGATLDLTAVLTPADASVTITWTSSRPQYATVKAKDGDPNSCVIRGRAMGRTYVYAWVGSKIAARCFVTVTTPKASSIKLNAKSVTLNPSGAYSTYKLWVTTTPTYHSDSIVWSTDDAESAIVSIEPSQDGKTCTVTAKSDGSETKTCTVTATLSKGVRSAVCQITVNKIPEKYVRVTTSAVVPLGNTRPLTAVVYPANAFDKAVTWSVFKNPQFASVDQKGMVNGIALGNAIIKVTTANGRWALCAVKVKLVRYDSFSASPSSKVLEKGTSFQIKTKRSPTYVSYPDVTFSSSNKDVATVDENGVVIGESRGYATITVSADKGRVTRYINVRVISSSEEIQVTVSAIGDVMLGGDPRKGSFTRFDNLWNKYGSGYFLEKIKSQLKGVVFANLEIPLIDTNGIANGSRSYIFRGKPEYARALSAGGIDAVDLDNNHIMDYGSRGYSSTRAAVSGQSVGFFGLGKVFYKMQNGIKIGFVGFRPENISTTQMKSIIRAVQSRCDIVIASFHWGIEYENHRTSQQIIYGRAAVDAGADLVVGHHSHVIGGIELYKGKHIVYGLGTIVSAVELPKDTRAFIYQHTFSVTGTSVSNARFEIVPVRMTDPDNKKYNDAQPVFATDSDAANIIESIEDYSPNNNPF